MSLYPKRLRASLLMTGLLVLALTLEDVHAKWRFKFNIFGGGKTSSVPRLSTSHLTPVTLPPSILNFHLDTVGLSYRGRPHSQPSAPDLPIGWNVPMKTQVPLGGTHTNIYERPPAFNPFFKSGATQSLSGEGEGFTSSRLDYGLRSHSHSLVPAWPTGWKIPKMPLATLPAHISPISSFGGTRTNIYDRPPAYNPFFKSGATQSLSGEGDSFSSIGSHSQLLDPIYERLLTYNSASKSVATQAQRNMNLQRKSHPGEGGTSSSSDFDIGELFTGIETTVRDNSTDKNETLPAETVHYPEATKRSGLGLGTGPFPGALSHSLTPTHNREVERAEGKGTEDNNVSIPTTSDLGLDETVTTTEETQEASTFWLPVASSAPARITRDIFRKPLPHPNDPSRMEEFEYYACFGPDSNPAEQIFGKVSIISVIITLLVSF